MEGMKSTLLFVFLGILSWRSCMFSFVDGDTNPSCSLSTTKNVEGSVDKGFSETHLNGKSGTFRSPGYPRAYPPNSEHLWKITVQENSEIILELESFELESHEECAYDFVEVRSGHERNSPLLEKLCGNSTNIIRSSTNRLLVKFVTDDTIQKRGFRAMFKAGSCRAEIHSEQGTFHSTNYPQDYLPHTDCTWKIAAPKNHIIILRFLSFEVESHEECAYDYLEVRNGPETDGTLLGRFCGKIPSDHSHLFSTSNVITVRFVTDGSVQESGFDAEYQTVVCGGDIVANKGTILSPNYLGKYLPNLDCVWSIASAKGGRLSLKFKSFELDSHEHCEDDYVEIRDGTISSGKLIGKFCGHDVPEYIVSTGNTLSIRFVTNGNVETAGFLAEFNSDFCVQDVSSANGKVELNSAGYKPNTECVWKIKAPDDRRIAIKFNYLGVEDHDQCSYDYVAIYDNDGLKSRLLKKFCGDKAPEEHIFSSGNKMVVKFITDGSYEKTGFSADYTTVGCGPSLQNVTNDLRTLSSPGYPSVYPTDMMCTWNFHITKPRNKVKMRITDLDVPCTPDNYIEIRTPKEVELPYRVCRNSSAHLHDVISTGDVTVIFHSGSSGIGRGFRLEYAIADCQLNYTKDNGLLLSPKYPYGYFSNWRCAISIDSPPGSTISLYFGSFLVRRRDIEADPTCAHASLKVYDGKAEPDLLLANLCGSSTPNPIFSTGNRIIMVMRTYNNADALYSISYTTTHKGRGCGGLLSNTNGTFYSPLYPQPYKESGSCIWYLSVPSFHTMTLRFSFYDLTSTAGCTSNYVELYEGHAEIQSRRFRKICGGEPPMTYKSQSNEFMLKLVTDHNNEGSGFVAHFQMDPYGGA